MDIADSIMNEIIVATYVGMPVITTAPDGDVAPFGAVKTVGKVWRRDGRR